MTEDMNTAEGWGRSDRPPNLHRRFPFSSYAETSAFLDRLATLSKETDYYPDISFAKTYANVTVHARDGTALSAGDIAFAQQVNGLAAAAGSRG